MLDIENYKGVYFGNENEQKYYEGGAHFKYKDLYNCLENLLLTLPYQRRGISEEQKKSKFDFFHNRNYLNYQSRNIRNIKPLIESLTQKLTEITKDKINRNFSNKKILSKNEEIFNNKFSRNNKMNVPNNSKNHFKNNISITHSHKYSLNKNFNFFKEENINKNSLNIGKMNIMKMNENNINNKKGNKFLNISQGKNNNSRNYNTYIFDLFKSKNISKDIMNKTTNAQNSIPHYLKNNQKNHSSNISRNKNLEKQRNSFIYNTSFINNKKGFSSNKSKISIHKKINHKNFSVKNPNNFPKKRDLILNILKSNSNKKIINKNNKNSKKFIDYTSSNNGNSNHNFFEISVLSDLNSPSYKKKNDNVHYLNMNKDNFTNQNNVTTNNNIILKPKINISFVNNINTITTQKSNKSRNKNSNDGNSINTFIKNGFLTEIYNSPNYNLTKKSSNSFLKNKLNKNKNSVKTKNNINVQNKLTKNFTSEKKLKNYFNFSEQYFNLQKKINHLKVKTVQKNKSIPKFIFGKNFFKNNNNKCNKSVSKEKHNQNNNNKSFLNNLFN